jgi:chromosome condensin MukBEF MukE localization factor
MGNDSATQITAWSFLQEPDASTYFAKVDYELKNGRHIQQRNEQAWLFRFIDKNEESLALYYRTYFGVILSYGGEANEKYYFLDFMADSRGGIPLENRVFMQNEFIIVGFMLYKIVFIDGYIELGSVKSLQRMLRQDYEELKPGLFRVLAKAKGINITQMNQDKLDAVVESALKAFHKIGWVELNDDAFEILDSFQRLPKVYGLHINAIDDWLKNEIVK